MDDWELDDLWTIRRDRLREEREQEEAEYEQWCNGMYQNDRDYEEWRDAINSSTDPLPKLEEDVTMFTKAVLLPDTGEGGYLITMKPLANVDQIIKSTVANMPTLAPSVCELNGKPVRLAVASGYSVAGVQLDNLRIRTFYKLEGNVLLPVFTAGGDAIEMTCTWTPPGHLKMNAAVSAKHDGMDWVSQHYFMFGTSAYDPGFWKLPLPNSFEDGRMCLGRDYLPKDKTLVGLLAKIVDHLHSSHWNTDIAPDYNLTKALFRFDPSTLANAAPTRPWTEVARKVNRVEMEALFA